MVGHHRGDDGRLPHVASTPRGVRPADLPLLCDFDEPHGLRFIGGVTAREGSRTRGSSSPQSVATGGATVRNGGRSTTRTSRHGRAVQYTSLSRPTPDGGDPRPAPTGANAWLLRQQ